MRRYFPIRLTINRRSIKEIIIDSHFEERHSESINDEIILALVTSLDGRELEADNTSPDGFEYYVTEPIYFNGKPYKLIWLLHPQENYLGVVNCFRRSRG